MSRQGSWDRKIWEDLSGILDGSTIVPSSPTNIEDALNSSTTPILAGGSFTGSWVDVGGYSDVVVAVKTDQNGSYAIQFSPDAVNVDSTLTRYYDTALINAPHRFTVTRKYYRVVFNNTSSSDQTILRLQSLYGAFGDLNAPTDTVMDRSFDAIATRPTDFDDELVLGLRQGYSVNLKFGYNDDINSSTSPEVLASFGGTFTPLTTASTLTVSSSSSDDSSLGTGARSLFISGLDSTRRSQIEFITLNGTTPVVTTNTWLGINRVVVFTVGSGSVNAGDISLTDTTGGTNQAYIPTGKSVTQQCIYHVQDGHIGLIRRITINALKLTGGQSPRITAELVVFNPKVTQARYTLRRYKLDTNVYNDVIRLYKPPIRLDPTDVCWLTISTDQNGTSVDGEIDVIEVRQAST